jgi:hypothetical protein
MSRNGSRRRSFDPVAGRASNAVWRHIFATCFESSKGCALFARFPSQQNTAIQPEIMLWIQSKTHWFLWLRIRDPWPSPPAVSPVNGGGQAERDFRPRTQHDRSMPARFGKSASEIVPRLVV